MACGLQSHESKYDMNLSVLSLVVLAYSLRALEFNIKKVVAS